MLLQPVPNFFLSKEQGLSLALSHSPFRPCYPLPLALGYAALVCPFRQPTVGTPEWGDIETRQEAAGFGKVDGDLCVRLGYFLITSTVPNNKRGAVHAWAKSAPHHSLLFTLEIYMLSLPSLCPPARPYKSCPRVTGHRAGAAALSE